MIIIELLAEDKEIAEEFINENPDVVCLTGHKFQGEPEMVRLMVELSPLILTSVVTIVTTLIKAKKHVVIKYKGIEIAGISEKNISKILKELLAQKQTGEKRK